MSWFVSIRAEAREEEDTTIPTMASNVNFIPGGKKEVPSLGEASRPHT
jgi:hypothetical protein